MPNACTGSLNLFLLTLNRCFCSVIPSPASSLLCKLVWISCISTPYALQQHTLICMLALFHVMTKDCQDLIVLPYLFSTKLSSCHNMFHFSFQDGLINNNCLFLIFVVSCLSVRASFKIVRLILAVQGMFSILL